MNVLFEYHPLPYGLEVKAMLLAVERCFSYKDGCRVKFIPWLY